MVALLVLETKSSIVSWPPSKAPAAFNLTSMLGTVIEMVAHAIGIEPPPTALRHPGSIGQSLGNSQDEMRGSPEPHLSPRRLSQTAAAKTTLIADSKAGSRDHWVTCRQSCQWKGKNERCILIGLVRMCCLETVKTAITVTCRRNEHRSGRCGYERPRNHSITLEDPGM